MERRQLVLLHGGMNGEMIDSDNVDTTIDGDEDIREDSRFQAEIKENGQALVHALANSEERPRQ